MANTKISAQTENTIPIAEDLLATIDDPSGTPLSRKSTILNVLGVNSVVLLKDETDSSTPFSVDWATEGAHDMIVAFIDINRPTGTSQQGLRIDDDTGSEYNYDQMANMVTNTSGTTTSIQVSQSGGQTGVMAVYLILQRIAGGHLTWYMWSVYRDGATLNQWSMGRKHGHTGGFTRLSIINIAGSDPDSVRWEVYGVNKK